MPVVKKALTPLISASAGSKMAQSPDFFAHVADGLYNTIQHWYDAYNGGLLCMQPIQRLLSLSNCNHFYELMTALSIPKEYAKEFRKNLAYFNGTLNDFIMFYKNNPDIFNATTYFRPEKPSVSTPPAPNVSVPKISFSSWFTSKYQNFKSKFYNRLNSLFTMNWSIKNLYSVKHYILSYKNKYFNKYHKAWHHIVITLPFISLWTLGYRYTSNTDLAANDNQTKTTFVTNNNHSIFKPIMHSNCASIADLSNMNTPFQHFAHSTIDFYNDYKSHNRSLPHSKNPLLAQKDADLAEFTTLYRQCSYNNYVKLNNGHKIEAFQSANRSLKKHGFKPLHPRLYCSGMSIASLCQAQDIFKQKHPNSYIIPAIDEILNKCHNIHHCASLKRDLRKITNNYNYSSNPTKDIKNYMLTHKNAIVFLWTPRGGGNFHHQTFFQPKLSGSNFYIFSSFNYQRWGNQDDFSSFMKSRAIYGNGSYFTDFSEGIDKIATKYVLRDIAKNKQYVTQASLPSRWAIKKNLSFVIYV